MTELNTYVFEVNYLDVETGQMSTSTYRAEDESHAVELFHDFHPNDVVESVVYRGEA